MNRFQKLYIFMYLFSSLGIVGNMELDVPTPMIWKIIFGISAFFTAGKIIYTSIKNGCI